MSGRGRRAARLGVRGWVVDTEIDRRPRATLDAWTRLLGDDQRIVGGGVPRRIRRHRADNEPIVLDPGPRVGKGDAAVVIDGCRRRGGGRRSRRGGGRGGGAWARRRRGFGAVGDGERNR